MTIDTLQQKLTARGLTVEKIQLYNVGGVPGIRDALRVTHDYSGLYPSDDARAARDAAFEIARKNGFSAEDRGCKTATIIYAASDGTGGKIPA